MRIAESYFKGVGHTYPPPFLLRIVGMLEDSAKSLSRNRYLEEDELGASELDER